jgi:hypothetical protein
MPTHPAPLRVWHRAIIGLPVFTLLLAVLCLLAACQGSGTRPTLATGGSAQTPQATSWPPASPWPRSTRTPDAPLLALSIRAEEIEMAPTPLRAGYPFTITGVIHNDSAVPAPNVPVLIHLSANQEELGYTSFIEIMSITVPASQSVPISVPVHWNLAGGEHHLWVQVNRLPNAWQPQAPTPPEENLADNVVLLDLTIDPFDAYVSDLCPGRVDLEVGPLDVLPDPDKQLVIVQIHNLGNRAAYNVPVIALSRMASGIAYSPAIAPCGGTTRVQIALDQPFVEGESFSVRVNPPDWEDGLVEDNYANNEVSVSSGLPGAAEQQLGSLHDYDFRIDAAEFEVPQASVVLIRVYNIGTRDAANVPILVTNEAGRKLNDVVPLVQGSGSGVAAIRLASLWNRGGKLTFTVNPEGAKGGYPETNRQNNIATFAVP